MQRRGWVAGSQGTVISATSDGGNSWIPQTTKHLNRAPAVCTSPAMASEAGWWNQRRSAGWTRRRRQHWARAGRLRHARAWLNGLYFATDGSGRAVGGPARVVLDTRNGGTHGLGRPPTAQNLTSVHFASDTLTGQAIELPTAGCIATLDGGQSGPHRPATTRLHSPAFRFCGRCAGGDGRWSGGYCADHARRRRPGTTTG